MSTVTGASLQNKLASTAWWTASSGDRCEVCAVLQCRLDTWLPMMFQEMLGSGWPWASQLRFTILPAASSSCTSCSTPTSWGPPRCTYTVFSVCTVSHQITFISVVHRIWITSLFLIGSCFNLINSVYCTFPLVRHNNRLVSHTLLLSFSFRQKNLNWQINNSVQFPWRTVVLH